MKSRTFASCFFILTLVGICSCLPRIHAQSHPEFTKGNEEYSAGRFVESIQHYNRVVQARRFSASLFYNLGNAWFRSGDLGRAILNYERALALEPQHPETTANLRLVRDQARALELRESWVERIFPRGNATSYSIVAAIAFWIAIFVLTETLLSRRRSRLRFSLILVSVTVFAATLFALYSLESGSKGRALAIIVGKDIQARLATADSSKSVLALPPGSEVNVLSVRGDWIYAALPNDLRGWIQGQAAEKVRL